ncbi:MAG: pilus assembly protein [Anaerolineales bacterium]|nr:MAG: pilus assembly protein [Anaerolineales bacterium]
MNISDRDDINIIEKGQSLVEFSVSLVVLLVMLAGLVDLGRGLFTYMALRDAAQEGALYGSFNPTDTAGIEARIGNNSNMLRDIVSSGSLLRSVSHDGSPCTGEAITVQVTYQNFPITMPFLGSILGRQAVDITASVTDTVLAPACTQNN